MTILQTKYGDSIDTDKFKGKGYGAFTQYVQQYYDKNFGKGTSDKQKWKVTLSATKTVTVNAEIEIEADNMKEAEKKAIEEARDGKTVLDWEDYCSGDAYIEDIGIDSVEEVDGEDE